MVSGEIQHLFDSLKADMKGIKSISPTGGLNVQIAQVVYFLDAMQVDISSLKTLLLSCRVEGK